MSRSITTHRYLWLGLAVCLLLAGVLSYYASASPDGLERVAADLGFADSAQQSATSSSPLSDYGISGNYDRFSLGAAGVIGVLATAALAFTLFTAIARANRGKQARSAMRLQPDKN